MKKLLIILCLGLAMSGCDYRYSKPNWEYVPHMRTQPSYKYYKPNPVLPSGITAQLPIPGTIARDYVDEITAFNPVARNQANLARGKFVYENNCLVCHGAKGRGDGPVVPRFAAPPDLLAANAQNLTDAQIYELITKGRGRMGAYGGHILREDRWKVVHYMRTLQGK